GGTQHALDPEHLVTDGVAVAERGQDLMNPDHARLRGASSWLGRAGRAWSSAGPFGRPARTSHADGMSWRRRSAQPGATIPACAGGACFSRSNISRYLRSMTFHS